MSGKFKIYGGNEKDKATFLKLSVYDRTIDIDLVACDSDGNKLGSPYILSITDEGTLLLYPSVNPNIGLKLDKSGRIVVE